MSTEAIQASPYTRLGEETGVRRFVERFYGVMDTLPEARTIREMHAVDLAPMVEKLCAARARID